MSNNEMTSGIGQAAEDLASQDSDRMADPLAPNASDRPHGNCQKPAVSALIASCLFSVISLATYHLAVAHQDGSIATVDIAELVKIRELQFTSLLSKPNVTDKDRQDAYVLVSKIGPEIEAALSDLQSSCSCTIVVKSAVLAGSGKDMTEEIKRKLGMAGMSSKSFTVSMAASISSGLPQGLPR
jgi:hypothetical protein